MNAVATRTPTTVASPTTGSRLAAQPSLGPPTHDEIARTAYLLWAARGCIDGDDVDHWLEAEARLRRERAAFDVILMQPGDRAIELIREIRAATGLDLVTVKALVEEAPQPVKRALSREEAESLVRELQGAGGVLEIRPSA